jgi:hypothetical protein
MALGVEMAIPGGAPPNNVKFQNYRNIFLRKTDIRVMIFDDNQFDRGGRYPRRGRRLETGRRGVRSREPEIFKNLKSCAKERLSPCNP